MSSTTPADAAASDDLPGRLARVVGRITRRIRPNSGELSMGHYSTLASIERADGCRPGELSRIERVSPPTMTRILSTLEDRGLIVRQQTAGDARSVTIGLTDQGRAVVLRTRAERAAVVAELLQGLSNEQLDVLAGALPVLERVAAAAAAPEGAGDR